MQVMSKAIVHEGQSLLDKAVETTGSIENTFEMAFLNKISDVTEDVKIGTELIVSKVTNRIVANYFNESNRPATAVRNLGLSDTNKINYGFPTQF